MLTVALVAAAAAAVPAAAVAAARLAETMALSAKTVGPKPGSMGPPMSVQMDSTSPVTCIA